MIRHNVVLMLCQHLRRWHIIKTTLDKNVSIVYLTHTHNFFKNTFTNMGPRCEPVHLNLRRLMMLIGPDGHLDQLGA